MKELSEILELLENIRLEKKLSTQNFVKELGTSRMAYVYWIKGKTKPNKISLHHIKKYLEKHEGSK